MRERDVRNALKEAMVATGAFSEVLLTGLPEQYAGAASDLTLAIIEPGSSSLTIGWDAQLGGGLDYTARLNVTLLARHDDPQLRDELAEALLNTLHNAANGQSLAGITLPAKTLVQSWNWLPAAPPERRIAAVVTISYLVTWEGWDTSQ
jgi:hypothetical protein